MSAFGIEPKYRLVMTFDIRPEMQERYYRYVMREFVPQVREMGLYMVSAWHTVYGNYPLRRLEFVTESLEVTRKIFADDRWKDLETRLKTYTTNYSRRLLNYQDTFQV